jgi:UDP-N-acetylmuramoyl-tripeptide--D-alanyl-D-alanine ligase
VDDTRLGLGRLAHVWRKQFEIPVVGVTGSNGKTTVKEMIAAIQLQQGNVLATRGNLNNEIGVPLTLLRIQDQHDSAVIEMGANHPGEIQYLTSLVCPTVALITNAGSAHLEGFGSYEGVARAKGEIFSGLAEDGVAVINADDRFATLWMDLARGRKVMRFGLVHESEVYADWEAIEAGEHLEIYTPEGSVQVNLSLPGRHNVMNALAATAVSLAMGATLDNIRSGLESLQPVKGRLQDRQGQKGMQIIDDTYNANPASLDAALQVLAGRTGVHWLVLGDMGELGEGAEELHYQAGEHARAAGVDRLFAVGDLSKQAVQGFGEGAHWFRDGNSLARELLNEWEGKGTVLVKGSRAMQMERVVEYLESGFQEERRTE